MIPDNSSFIREIEIPNQFIPVPMKYPVDLTKVDPIALETFSTLIETAKKTNSFYVLALAFIDSDESFRICSYDGVGLKDWLKNKFENLDSQEPIRRALFYKVDGKECDYIGQLTPTKPEDRFVTALFNIYQKKEEKLPKAYYELACCYEEKCNSLVGACKKEDYVRQQLFYLERAVEAGYGEARIKLGELYIRIGKIEQALFVLKSCSDLNDWKPPFILGELYFTNLLKPQADARFYFETVLKRAANPPAQVFCYLGQCYLEGIGGDVDAVKGLEMLSKASSMNLREAHHALGMYYMGKNNTSKAYDYFLKATEQDCPEAEVQIKLIKEACFACLDDTDAEKLNSMGHYHETGKYGFEIDSKKAFEYFTRAAELNSRYAMYNMGSCYKWGWGVAQSAACALEWFKKAASNGFKKAFYEAGFLCIQGAADLPKDEKGAFAFFQQGAAQKEPGCLYQLANCYANGNGTDINIELAKENYLEAAKAKHPEALNQLGYFHSKGKCGFTLDKAEAFKYYQEAALLGLHSAMYNCGLYYKSGLGGVQKSGIQARDWFRKTLEAGCTEAFFDLGYVYLQGYEDLPKNEKLAFITFLQGAEKEETECFYPLAECYEKGRGTPINLALAKNYYLKAAALNKNRDAFFKVGLSYVTGQCGFEKDMKEAFKYYLEAANLGHPAAMLNLGDCFKLGLGDVKVSSIQALEWYQKAADAGESKAYFSIGSLHLNDHALELAFSAFMKGAELKEPKCLNELAKCYENGIGTAINLELAKEKYLAAAEAKDKESFFIVGLKFETGASGFPLNKGEAVKYYLEAANLGHDSAMYNLGVLFKKGGEGIERSGVKALEWLTKAKEAGVKEVLSEIGFLHLYGCKDLPKNRQLAFLSFREGVEKNEAGCFYGLATCYHEGIGTEKDPNLAKEWFLKAAEAKCPKALNHIGCFYAEGTLGFPKDQELAFKYFHEAAKLGNAAAIYNLGDCYTKGRGTNQSGVEALKWFRKAGEETPGALYKAGCLLLVGWHDLPKNEKAAFEFFQLGAEKEEPGCLFQLGVCYLKGTGTKKDFLSGKVYLQQAAEAKNVDALHTLGSYFEKGEGGFPQDKRSAFKFHTLAANLGSIASMLSLGKFEQESSFGDAGEAAHMWFKKAWKKDERTAAYYLGELYFYGAKWFPTDKAKALTWYKKGAKKDVPNCIYKLGYCYEKGIGTHIDEKLAKENYWKAAKLDHPQALVTLGHFFNKGLLGFNQDHHQAFNFYWKAAQLGDREAMQLVGLYFSKGMGGAKHCDIKAFHWLKKSADLGFKAACLSVAESYRYGIGTDVNKELAKKYRAEGE